MGCRRNCGHWNHNRNLRPQTSHHRHTIIMEAVPTRPLIFQIVSKPKIFVSQLFIFHPKLFIHTLALPSACPQTRAPDGHKKARDKNADSESRKKRQHSSKKPFTTHYVLPLSEFISTITLPGRFWFHAINVFPNISLYLCNGTAKENFQNSQIS